MMALLWLLQKRFFSERVTATALGVDGLRWSKTISRHVILLRTSSWSGSIFMKETQNRCKTKKLTTFNEAPGERRGRLDMMVGSRSELLIRVRTTHRVTKRLQHNPTHSYTQSNIHHGKENAKKFIEDIMVSKRGE